MTPPGTFWGQEPTFVSAPRQALHRTPHRGTTSRQVICPTAIRAGVGRPLRTQGQDELKTELDVGGG